MRATPARLEGYLYALATHLDRLGAAVPPSQTLLRDQHGRRGFDLRATLPSSIGDRPADVRLAEVWEPTGDARGTLERADYGYELIDQARARRRAYHRHHVAYFRAVAEVDVHEHCEERLGAPICRHYLGLPVRDGYDAIRLLFVAWTEPGPLGCERLDCMDRLVL